MHKGETPASVAVAPLVAYLAQLCNTPKITENMVPVIRPRSVSREQLQFEFLASSTAVSPRGSSTVGILSDTESDTPTTVMSKTTTAVRTGTAAAATNRTLKRVGTLLQGGTK